MTRMNADIGANLTDGMYKGLYNGSKKHAPDLPFVLKRAWEAGLKHIVITGGSLEESKDALELARSDGTTPSPWKIIFFC
jgi:TatD DNase family protein